MQCSFVYLENALPYKDFSEEHAWEKSSKAEELRRQKELGFHYNLAKTTRLLLNFPRIETLSLLKRYAPAGRVLDIGCGDAGYMLQLPPKHLPCGIEISKELAAMGEKNLAARGGFVIHSPALEGLRQLLSADYAAVVMRSYLEHELQPLEALLESSRILKPSGILILKVPNYGSLNAMVMGRNWCGIRLPDHVNYFTPTHLSAMVERAGYRIHRFGLLCFRQPTSDNMWLIARKQKEPLLAVADSLGQSSL